MLDRHQDSAAPFAAYRNPLADSENDEQHGRPDADLRVGGEQADQNSRYAHQKQAEEEHALSADPVSEMSENEPAQRSRKEANGKCRERGQRAADRINAGEEQLAEDERGGGPKDEKVVPFDRGSDHRCCDNPAL